MPPRHCTFCNAYGSGSHDIGPNAIITIANEAHQTSDDKDDLTQEVPRRLLTAESSPKFARSLSVFCVEAPRNAILLGRLPSVSLCLHPNVVAYRFSSDIVERMRLMPVLRLDED